MIVAVAQVVQKNYVVADGTYSSSISQAYVDSLAQANVNTNGQNYANENGTCNITISYQKNSYSYYPVYFTFTNLSTYEQYNFFQPLLVITLLPVH